MKDLGEGFLLVHYFCQSHKYLKSYSQKQKVIFRISNTNYNLLTTYLLVKTKNNYLVLVYVESYVARHKNLLTVNIQWKSENILNFLLLVNTQSKYSKYQKANCQALPTSQAGVTVGSLLEASNYYCMQYNLYMKVLFCRAPLQAVLVMIPEFK